MPQYETPKAGPTSSIHPAAAASKASTEKNYGKGSSFMEKLSNLVTGGGYNTAKKAAGK